jgi:hypothetical protein
MSSVTGHAQGSGPHSSARSAPVNAAITPGSSRAGDTSMLAMRACAIGERSTAKCSIPGSWMLSVQRV